MSHSFAVNLRAKSDISRILLSSKPADFVSEMKRVDFSPGHILLVSSPHLQKAGHVSRIEKLLRAGGRSVSTALIQDGESRKNLSSLAQLYRKALEAKLDRRSLIVAVGGGVITDMAGFLAATYMRGISYVSVPTSLLGMVDASIGGKTGVDLAEGKNLVGAFWQPRLVWLNPVFLKTLPGREWKTGMAEVIKYGVIKDKVFFHWLGGRLKTKAFVSSWDSADITHLIYRSAAIKAAVVSADEREVPLKGGREILNFGHTIGHALEAASGYTRLSHGEAVSIGMAAAGHLSLQLRKWSRNEQLQLLSLLQAAGLPVRIPPFIYWPRFWKALHSDKKNISNRLRFVLPLGLGRVEVRSGLDPALVRQVLRLMGARDV